MARARRQVGAYAALMVVALIGVFPGLAWSQAPASACAGPVALVNGSFEDPASIGTFGIIDEDQVPGWSTTEPDGRIELWQSGYKGVPAASGEQFAELAANEPGELYQDVATVAGTQLGYAVSHRGRDGVDTMQIQIGPPGVAPNFTRDVSTGNTGWQQVLGTYRVPTGQTVTRFGFAALSSASSLISAGNFLDGVTFGSARCSVTLSKRLRPAADPGRFDLLLGDQVLVAGAGDGGRGPAGPVALGAVRVSERAAAGTRLDEYASAVFCRDAVSGELLAQAAGPELLLSFDRRRDAACTVANVRAPAVVAQNVLYPPGASGRFDLLINGRVQTAAAGDRAVAGPVALDAGDRVVVSERAAPGTRASDYVSGVECRSRAGRGPVVAEALRRRVSYTATADQVVACVLINLRRIPPAPAPPPQPNPAPAPAGGGIGELDLDVTARAISQRIAAGADARWFVTVRNPSAVSATAVRLVIDVHQAGLPPRTASLKVISGGCVRSRAVGICDVPRIEPGESVQVRIRARSRDLLSPVRLVAAATAAEPEPVVTNNLDRALVRVIRPPARPCLIPISAASPPARIAC